MTLQLSKKIFIVLLVIGFLTSPIFCFAQTAPPDGGDTAKPDTTYGLAPVAQKAYGVEDVKKLQSDPTVIAGIMVGAILALLGVIFMIQVIIAGVIWMTAQGNEEKITKAKQNLLHSIIGLVIVVAAYTLVNYVLQLVLSAVKTS